MTGAEVALYISRCHQASVDGGWWHDLETGEKLNRNKGELLCLIHSEISEAYFAETENVMDDKLVNRLGVEVELADTMIRVCDYIGGFDYQKVIPLYKIYCPFRTLGLSDPNSPPTFADLHYYVDLVMEDERKDKEEKQDHLALLILAIVDVAERRDLDLIGAIDDKLAFNAQRADHKPENRRKDHGKKF